MMYSSFVKPETLLWKCDISTNSLISLNPAEENFRDSCDTLTYHFSCSHLLRLSGGTVWTKISPISSPIITPKMSAFNVESTSESSNGTMMQRSHNQELPTMTEQSFMQTSSWDTKKLQPKVDITGSTNMEQNVKPVCVRNTKDYVSMASGRAEQEKVSGKESSEPMPKIVTLPSVTGKIYKVKLLDNESSDPTPKIQDGVEKAELEDSMEYQVVEEVTEAIVHNTDDFKGAGSSVEHKKRKYEIIEDTDEIFHEETVIVYENRKFEDPWIKNFLTLCEGLAGPTESIQKVRINKEPKIKSCKKKFTKFFKFVRNVFKKSPQKSYSAR